MHIFPTFLTTKCTYLAMHMHLDDPYCQTFSKLLDDLKSIFFYNHEGQLLNDKKKFSGQSYCLFYSKCELQ